jgi:hypothetical protein
MTEPSRPQQPNMMTWVLLAALGLNGAGTINTGMEVGKIKASMLDDISTRQWIEDGAAKIAQMQQKIKSISERADREERRLESLVNTVSTRMDRITINHNSDINSLDARIVTLGKAVLEMQKGNITPQRSLRSTLKTGRLVETKGPRQ